MNPFFHTGFSISDSLKSVRKSVLNYETIIVDRWFGTGDTWQMQKANSVNVGIDFHDGSQFGHFGAASTKWLCAICNLLCNHGLFGTLLQWRANGTFPGEN